MTQQTPSPQERGQRFAFFGMIISFALGLTKLIAGLVGHSYALVADAIESFTDILASAVILGSLRVATRPATERHPYGYGKAESLAGAIVAAMIFVAGIGMGVQAIHEIITPHHSPERFTLVVLVVVVLVKELLFRRVSDIAEQADSTAMTADAWHHRADAITSLFAFVGISVALIGGPGWEPADDWAALCGAGVILYNAGKLMVVPVRELMDVQWQRISEEARTIALGIPGVVNVQKVFTRKSGPVYWVDMHLWVDPEMNVRVAHSLSHKVKDSIKEKLPNVQDVLIHLEPGD